LAVEQELSAHHDLLALLDGLWILGSWGVPGMRSLSRWIEAVPLLSVGVMLFLLAALSWFLPFLMRWLLSTKPLPPGPMREHLERQARALGLRYGEIVVWNTQGRSLNAMVVGFTPRTRTIFITDALLASLPPDEILAVFSHEAGHAKRHHLPLFLVLFVATALLFEVAASILEGRGVPGILLIGLDLAFIWFVLLGSISRFFEREADFYGARHAADLDPDAPGTEVPGLEVPLPAGAARMIRALERIRRLSGRGSSHRHGTIESRIEAVAAFATDPSVQKRFARRKRRLLGLTGLALGAAVLVTAINLPREIAFAHSVLAFEDAIADYETALEIGPGKEAARSTWKRAHAGFTGIVASLDPAGDARTQELRLRALFNAADTLLHGLGDEAGAKRAFTALLGAIPATGLDAGVTGPLSFQARVEVGRILAHEGRVEEARRQLVRARAEMPDAEGDEGTWYRTRRTLLEAVVRGAEGRVDEARALLRDRVLHASRSDAPEWVEIRRDARQELERLGAQ
ncbi:MAG: M48 family metalloprotease, partial [Planctomycetota bacterium]